MSIDRCFALWIKSSLFFLSFRCVNPQWLCRSCKQLYRIDSRTELHHLALVLSQCFALPTWIMWLFAKPTSRKASRKPEKNFTTTIPQSLRNLVLCQNETLRSFHVINNHFKQPKILRFHSTKPLTRKCKKLMSKKKLSFFTLEIFKFAEVINFHVFCCFKLALSFATCFSKLGTKSPAILEVAG